MALRVCLLAYRFPILGRSTDAGFLWPLARELAKEGHSVTVISARSPLGKHEIIRSSVQVFYLYEEVSEFLNQKFESAAAKKLAELHAKNPFDIVHSVDGSGLQIARHKNDLGLAVCFDVEATQLSQIFSILGMGRNSISGLLSTAIGVAYKFLKSYFARDRAILKSADGVFVSSPLQRIFLERYYMYPDFHIYTVPYGIEIGNISAPQEILIGKQKTLGLPSHAHIALTLSDFNEIKELTNLIDAFEKVAIKKPQSYLMVIGSGPVKGEAEYHTLNLALGNRVLFLGDLSEVEISEWISASEVFIDLGTRGSGFDSTMIEAMSQKKVIIGSEMGPVAHILEDGVDGFLIRPADILALAHLLIGIFSGSVPIQEIGEKARQKVINLFDLRKMVVALQLSYEKIINNTASRRKRWKKKNDQSRAS